MFIFCTLLRILGLQVGSVQARHWKVARIPCAQTAQNCLHIECSDLQRQDGRLPRQGRSSGTVTTLCCLSECGCLDLDRFGVLSSAVVSCLKEYCQPGCVGRSRVIAVGECPERVWFSPSHCQPGSACLLSPCMHQFQQKPRPCRVSWPSQENCFCVHAYFNLRRTCKLQIFFQWSSCFPDASNFCWAICTGKY